MAREAQAGRLHACGERTVGGYPFRIEMRCREPRSQLRGFGRPVALRAGSLLAVAQIYDPTLLIAELTGPMIAMGDDGATNLTLDWRLLQASLRGFPLAFERTSLVFDDLKVRQTDAPDAPPLVAAKQIELHLRLRPGQPEPVFDLAVKGQTLALSAPATLAGRTIDVNAEAVVRGVKDLTPKPINELLRQWQADGGRVEISKIRVAQADAVAVATGNLGLTPQARLDGSLQVSLAGLEQMLAMILGPSSQGRAQASLLGGLAMLAGRSELEGKRAVALPLRVKEGAVSLGPLPLGQIPPLY
jgi:hypothetical protein